MKADYRVLLDACVLANFGVCDVLLRLSERPRLIVPHWTDESLSEVRRTHVERLAWAPEIAESFQQALRRAFPESLVSGYEPLMAALTNDPKDRHVLAAAIRSQCPLILTFNLKHFPESALAPWSLAARHPEDYLLVLYEMEPSRVMACLGEIAGRRKLEIEDVLIRLGRSLPTFSQRLLDDRSA